MQTGELKDLTRCKNMQIIQHRTTSEGSICQCRTIRDFLELFPQGIGRLLLVIDPADQPGPILAIVLELAERWQPHITLAHGGRLRDSGRLDESGRDDLVDLICLGWELKHRYSDISISRSLMGSNQQVLAEAAERKADVVLVPEALADCFQPPAAAETEAGASLPCPIVIVMATEAGRSNGSDFEEFR
jgi:hypothetical protein